MGVEMSMVIEIHLRLTLACEGSGRCASATEMPKRSTSGLLLDAREVEEWGIVSKGCSRGNVSVVLCCVQDAGCGFMYLMGVPYHRSPLMSSTLPKPTRPPEIHQH